jgi:hypothetical protein
MGIRQLEEFLGQADQKGFWIFTYANLAGAFFGAFLGNSLLDTAPPSLKLPGILAGVILGVMTTWKVKGRPIYRWALSYVLFVLRRYLKLGLGDSTIDAALYFRARTIEQAPFMLVTTRGGKQVPVLVHRGSGASADAWDALDGLLLLPATDGKAWGSGPGAGARTHQTDTMGSTLHAGAMSSNGRSPHPGAAGERLDREYLDWEL